MTKRVILVFFFFQAEDGIRDLYVTGVQTCALPIFPAQQGPGASPARGSVQAVPFNQASHHGCEQGPSFVVTPSAAQQTFGPFPLPATGYLRRVLVEVTTTTAGTGGT